MISNWRNSQPKFAVFHLYSYINLNSFHGKRKDFTYIIYNYPISHGRPFTKILHINAFLQTTSGSSLYHLAYLRSRLLFYLVPVVSICNNIKECTAVLIIWYFGSRVKVHMHTSSKVFSASTLNQLLKKYDKFSKYGSLQQNYLKLLILVMTKWNVSFLLA